MTKERIDFIIIFYLLWEFLCLASYILRFVRAAVNLHSRMRRVGKGIATHF